MIIIQIIIIFVAIALALFAFVGKQSHFARAWKKISLCLLALVMIMAVLFPDLLNILAQSVGVGRGADLLLYGLIIAFIAYSLNTYVLRQKDKDALYRLARKVAILEANERYKMKSSKVK